MDWPYIDATANKAKTPEIRLSIDMVQNTPPWGRYIRNRRLSRILLL
jgi:hypothetical protein